MDRYRKQAREQDRAAKMAEREHYARIDAAEDRAFDGGEAAQVFEHAAAIVRHCGAGSAAAFNHGMETAADAFANAEARNQRRG